MTTWTWDDIQTNDNPLDAAQEAKADTGVQLTEAVDIIAELLYWTNRREMEGRDTCDMVAYRRAFRRAREFAKSHDKSNELLANTLKQE